jgi:hypothetical protein
MIISELPNGIGNLVRALLLRHDNQTRAVVIKAVEMLGGLGFMGKR